MLPHSECNGSELKQNILHFTSLTSSWDVSLEVGLFMIPKPFSKYILIPFLSKSFQLPAHAMPMCKDTGAFCEAVKSPRRDSGWQYLLALSPRL